MYLEKTISISSAHILLDLPYQSKCTRLHGHNWYITVGIEGELQETGMIIDFTDIKQIINRFDHVIILPDKNSRVKQHKISMKVTIDNEYLFPPSDCVFIPFSQVTAENLAQTIRQDICEYLRHTNKTARVVYVKVEETENNVAIA